MQTTDHELISLVAGGDANALAAFYDRYSRFIYGAVLHILNDTDNAEEILQEVFMQVWRKASTYKAELGSPKNWLVHIAHNRAINLVRSRRMRLEKAEVGIPQDDYIGRDAALVDGNFIGEITNSEHKKYLLSALKELPEEQVNLLDLAFFQGFSHSEIAELLHQPLGTVKSKIRYALLGLRKSLAFLEGDLV